MTRRSCRRSCWPLRQTTRDGGTLGDGGDELFAGYDPFHGARDGACLPSRRAGQRASASCAGSPGWLPLAVTQHELRLQATTHAGGTYA